MSKGAIYIDDAGTPGSFSLSEFLPEDRKSYCAVIVPPSVLGKCAHAMDILIDGVRQDFGVNEIHCTDIYGGRGGWKGVPPEKRKEIFDFLSQILTGFQLPVLFQTWSSASFADHPALAAFKSRSDVWWRLDDVSHFSLLLLCYRIAKQIDEYVDDGATELKEAMPCFVDEGLVKSGASVKLPSWGHVFEGQRLMFEKSQDSFGIQLADFAAFCIARSQWIIAKQDPDKSISESDQHILKIASKINWCDGNRIVVNPNDFSREGYEFLLMRDRMNKNLSRRLKSKK